MKKYRKQKNIENSEISVSRSTSNGMKKNKRHLYKLVIPFLFLVLSLLITPVSKAQAASVELMSSTIPKDNELMVGDPIRFNFEFFVSQWTSTPGDPNKQYAVIFQPTVDGVDSPQSNNGGMQNVFAGDRTKDSGKIQKITVSDNQLLNINTKQYSWRLYDYYTKEEIGRGSFTFKINPHFVGWYYLLKKNNANSTYAFYQRSDPFTTEALCKTALQDYLSKNQGYIISENCTSYTSLPPLPQNDPVPITPQKTTTSSSVYNLLAPIGAFKVAPDNIGDYFNTIFLIAIGLCGALAVIMIVIGGIQYMGDESIFGKTEAKSRIRSAILGLLIALGSYALLRTINPALLGGNINIKQVSAEIDAETETAPWTGTSTITGTTANCPEGYVNVATYGNPSTINVCKSIEENLKKLLATAKSNNPSIILSGSGSRTYDEQVALRRQNSCPDIYNSPSNKCSPETARPGHSKHESGKAIDFSCNGKTMTASGGRNSVCFLWLKANTAPNFKNLASESWHWSDDGH